MKMKKSLLSVVFLLATSSAMAAMSYSSAEVKTDMSGSVTNTNSALLSFEGIPGDNHAARLRDGGKMKLNLNKGNSIYGEREFGLQQNSKYEWDDLFMIRNRSENFVDVTITNEVALPSGVEVFIKIDGESDWQNIEENGGAKFTNWNIDGRKIDLKVEVAKDAPIGNFVPNLVVNATDAGDIVN